MNKCGAFLICLLSLFFGAVAASQAEPSAPVSVTTWNYKIKCPVSLMVDAKISSTSAGNVTIKYVFSTRFETS